MARRYYSSTAVRTTLAAGINNTDTSISITAASGLPSSYPYTMVIDQDVTGEEVIEVTNRVGTTLTVTRGVDGTTAVSHSAGASINHAVSARDFDEPNAHIQASGLHAPIGSVMAYAAATAPTDWLLCDGSAVSRTTYSSLFALINTTYGVGDGSTTFNLPNMKGRVVVGRDSADTDFDTLGEAAGSKTSTANHTHPVDHDHGAESFTSGTESANHTHAGNTGNVSADHSHSGNTGYVSSDHAHWAYIADTYAGNGSVIRKSYSNPGSATSGFHANHYHGFSTGGISANHTHGYTTGNVSANHTHTTSVNLAAFTGTSGASSVGAASGNLQPYVVLNYIIRAA